MNYTIEIAKRLAMFCSSNGYQHSEYFNKFLDDILYTFGKPVQSDHIPDQKTGDFLFELTALYGEAVARSEPYTDLLGNIYMELGSKYSRVGLGQFFTPQHICDLMASLTIGQASIANDKEFIEINEPCVGAGAMLLAVLKVIKSREIKPLKNISLTCNDLDIMCCKMATAQIMSNLLINQDSLASIVVWHGNTLGNIYDWNLFYGAESPEYSKYRSNISKKNTVVSCKTHSSFQQLNLF